jgi:hypothetical protein
MVTVFWRKFISFYGLDLKDSGVSCRKRFRHQDSHFLSCHILINRLRTVTHFECESGNIVNHCVALVIVELERSPGLWTFGSGAVLIVRVSPLLFGVRELTVRAMLAVSFSPTKAVLARASVTAFDALALVSVASILAVLRLLPNLVLEPGRTVLALHGSFSATYIFAFLVSF